ncbi:MAG: putative dipeptidase [Armatimonadetes bacterium CSP1-3]|nr:MAG: putative dipeptidase [Armatimonadetes bacterium CSP1-3]
MTTLTAEATALHREAIIIDGRDPTHLMYRLTYDEKPVYLDVLREGGVTAPVVDAVWIEDDFTEAARGLASWHRRAVASNGRARIALRSEDIRAAKAAGLIAFVLSAQSSAAVEGDFSLVEMLQRMGLRVMQLTYQHRSLAGDGCGEATDGGLSRFGQDLVREMCRVGIVVDLSHASDRTVLEAAEAATKPVILSHTNARALCDTRRNASDAMIRAVAATGGVIGVSAYSDIIVPKGGTTGTTIEQMLSHVDYLCGLVGEDHVAIGLDIGEGRNELEVGILHARIPGLGAGPKYRYVGELTSRANLPALTAAMAARGYAPARIRKVLGLNFLRVFETVWVGAER